MDFRRSKLTEHSALFVNGEEVKRVDSSTFLEVHIFAKLTHLVGKVKQKLHFLRKHRKAYLPRPY